MDLNIFRKYNQVSSNKHQPVSMRFTYKDMGTLKRADIQRIIDIDNGINIQCKCDHADADKITLIVKCTHGCNLNCPYCYDKLSSTDVVMSLDMVEKIITIFKDVEKLEWIWHGGEPLTMGPKFFLEANTLLKKICPNVDIHMQSNGTLLNDEFFDIFDKTEQRYPGLSFDGIDNQVTRKSTVKILRAFKEYKKRGKHCGGILVISNDNIENIIDEYEYGKLIGSSPQMNLIFDPGYDTGGKLLKSDKVLKHLQDFFLHWVHDKKGASNRLLEDYVRHTLGCTEGFCHSIYCTGRWFGIEPNGNMLPCGRNWNDFEPYGNIMDVNSIDEIINGRRFQEWDGMCKSLLKNGKCSTCEWLQVCMGDCFGVDYMYDHEMKSPDPTICEINMGMYDFVMEYLEDLDIYRDFDNYNMNFISILIRSKFLSPKLINEVHEKGIYNG